MASPLYAKGGQRLSSLLMPWTTGMPKVAATGIQENGTDICNLYAPRSQGTAPASTGILKNGTDIASLFAKNTGAVGGLPIDGNSYSRNVGRGTATLQVSLKSDGTYTVTNTVTTLASGTWLPSGASVSQCTCRYTGPGFANEDDPGGGTASYTNGAPSAAALTTTRSFTASATSTASGDSAYNAGTLLIEVFKSGALASSSQISLSCSASGL